VLNRTEPNFDTTRWTLLKVHVFDEGIYGHRLLIMLFLRRQCLLRLLHLFLPLLLISLNDPIIQKTLDSLQGFIKVDTPFNIDRLRPCFLITLTNLSSNQSFVVCEKDFWPFDEGDWKIEQGDVIKNTTDDALDLQAIRVYRDREIALIDGRRDLPLLSLLPGMKMSPMFVAWQKNKPRVITDHSASGLNDGIPRAEGRGKVR
jgi:hypothetical protein